MQLTKQVTGHGAGAGPKADGEPHIHKEGMQFLTKACSKYRLQVSIMYEERRECYERRYVRVAIQPVN